MSKLSPISREENKKPQPMFEFDENFDPAAFSGRTKIKKCKIISAKESKEE